MAAFLLHLFKYILANNSRMVVWNLHPLAFVVHPNMVPSDLCYLAFADNISASITLITQDPHHG